MVPLAIKALVMLEMKIDWVEEALHSTTEERALTIESEAVTVQVPVAIDIEDGKVTLTPAPTPRGLLIYRVKVYAVIADTVGLRTERVAPTNTLGFTVKEAVL